MPIAAFAFQLFAASYFAFLCAAIISPLMMPLAVSLLDAAAAAGFLRHATLYALLDDAFLSLFRFLFRRRAMLPC